MTEKSRATKIPLIFPYLLLAFMLFILFRAQECRADLKNGLRLCAENIIPSLFPYLVLSELFVSSLSFSSHKNFFNRAFSRLFRLHSSAKSVLLIGTICGFPVGARIAALLYQEGLLDKREAETLCAYANHTGPAFVIGGVGASLFGSVQIGFLFFLSQSCAGITCLLLSSFFRPKPKETLQISARHTSVTFVGAVRSSSIAIVNVCGFVLFFSLIAGIVCRAFSSFSLPFSAFLEVTNACKQASLHFCTSPKTACLFACFAITFGGLCAGMQSALYMKESGLSFASYLPRKLLEGFLSLFFFFLLTETVGI